MTYRNIRRGWYERDGEKICYCKSGWERSYCAYLDWLVSLGEIVSWEYEPVEFEYHEVKRGTRYYIPDFRVMNQDGTHEWHEVKGRWTQKARTQVSRFRKYYPEEKLVVIDRDAYNAIKAKSNLIPNWE